MPVAVNVVEMGNHAMIMQELAVASENVLAQGARLVDYAQLTFRRLQCRVRDAQKQDVHSSCIHLFSA